MKEPQSKLTTVGTGLIAFFALWIGYRCSVVVPAFSHIFAGLGGEIPVSTRLVVGTPPIVYLALGLILSVAVIAKDFLLDRERTRLQVNVIGAVVSLMAYIFIQSAILEPVVELLEQIGISKPLHGTQQGYLPFVADVGFVTSPVVNSWLKGRL